MNFGLGILLSVLLGISGYMLYGLSGFPSYSNISSFLIALLLGASIGHDIGKALRDEIKTAFLFMGAFVGLTIILTYWVWGFNLLPATTLLTTIIVAGLHYTDTIEELSFEDTVRSVPGGKRIADNVEGSGFRRFSATVILVLLLQGFIPWELLAENVEAIASTE